MPSPMLADARIFPAKVVLEPKVAELPTSQNMASARIAVFHHNGCTAAGCQRASYLEYEIGIGLAVEIESECSIYLRRRRERVDPWGKSGELEPPVPRVTPVSSAVGDRATKVL